MRGDERRCPTRSRQAGNKRDEFQLPPMLFYSVLNRLGDVRTGEANPLHSIHDSNANLTLTDNILEIFLVNWMEENTEIQYNDINCFVNVANVKKQTAAKLFGTVLIALIYFFQLLEQLFSMASPPVRGTTFVSLCPIPFFPLHRTRFISSSLCFFPLPFLLLFGIFRWPDR